METANLIYKQINQSRFGFVLNPAMVAADEKSLSLYCTISKSA